MYLQAALLGVVQGLTEFLPVSSSAHLILARLFFGWGGEAQFGLAFDVACHVGTLLAVVAYYRVDLVRLLAAAPRALAGGADARAREGRLIVFGTVPLVVVGVLGAATIEEQARTPVVVVATLVVVSFAMLLAERVGARQRDDRSLTPGEAVLIGVAQVCALVPGVSRSGATISAALFLGLRRESGARFAFLLSVPAILAAAGYEALHLARGGMRPGDGPLFAIGVITSAVVGYATIKFFLQYVVRHSLDLFAWYRLALAGAATAWLVAR